MSSHDASTSHPVSTGRPRGDHGIAMLACTSAAVAMLVVTLVVVLTGMEGYWLIAGPIGTAAFGLAAWRAWYLDAIHGYFHDPTDEEDEDGNPEGGSGVRYPPDAPDGGGSLEFDWDGFVTGFWDHVDATTREPALP